jgi:hypothetical protein
MPRRQGQRLGQLLPLLRVLTRLLRLLRGAMLPLVATTREVPVTILVTR